MAAVKVIVNEPLAGMLGIEGGEIIVRVSGKITILQALKCAGIDLHRPEIQGCFMIICNNEIVPAGFRAQSAYVGPGDVIELLPVAAGG
ncbi:MAG TPA: MoaD/ThiS family protein [Firmicutes bacterium]|nr:MoaD/ThiS family protein [Bacillota bacterium]